MRDNMVRGLRTFCAAAKHSSFKLAARELCITPSAVSHQIKTLEETLGQTLFERRTRGIELTELGSALFGAVSPILADLNDVVATFVERASLRRILRINLPHFFASEMFVPRLSAFTDTMEGLEIRVDTSDAGTTHRGTSDASIVLLASPPRDVRAYPLFPLSLVPACAPSLATSLQLAGPRSLLRATLIVHESRSNAWNAWFDQCGVMLDERPNVIYLDSMFAVARAAEKGLGVALVPLPLSNAWFRSGALTRVSEQELLTPDCYYFVYRREDEPNADIRALRDWAISAFSQDEQRSSAA
jgi:LysR family glycine cleavage system transcriptional activator